MARPRLRRPLPPKPAKRSLYDLVSAHRSRLDEEAERAEFDRLAQKVEETNRTISRLLKLPGELRMRIIDYALAEDGVIKVEECRSAKKTIQPALTRVCRLLYRETVKVFWEINQFDFRRVEPDQGPGVMFTAWYWRMPRYAMSFRDRKRWYRSLPLVMRRELPQLCTFLTPRKYTVRSLSSLCAWMTRHPQESTRDDPRPDLVARRTRQERWYDKHHEDIAWHFDMKRQLRRLEEDIDAMEAREAMEEMEAMEAMDVMEAIGSSM